MTQTELARMLKISQAMVSRHVRAGMPTTSVEDAQEWRRANLDPRLVRRRKRAPRSSNGSKTVAGHPTSDPPADTWLDRVDRARARRAELELARLEGRSLDRGATVARLEKQMGAMRSRLLAIPTRIAARIPDAVMRAKVAGWIEAEIHAALQEISGGENGA